jgi:nicotinamide-nucleotide amidase
MSITDLALQRSAARLGRRLVASGQVVATAESCTGGWIAKVLTDVPGSSAWFGEGFVTYSNEAKRRRLGVPSAVLSGDGAVSEAAVRAMAVGALRRSGGDLAVAVSGIAGPGGGVLGKPVGTVWLCWGIRHGKTVRLTTRLQHFRGDREAVRRKTVRVALRGLLALVRA